MPTVHLLRHGHFHNPDKVLYGRLPEFKLSDADEAMAHAVTDYLVSWGTTVGRVVASPLQRAQQTATPIAEAFGHEIVTDERLIEAANDYEGRPLQSDARDFVHPRNWWLLRNPWRPSWGEPCIEQQARMWDAIRGAEAANPDSDTVIVSHQLPIWVARLSFERRRYLHDPRSRQCGLASLTSFTFQDGEPAAHIEVPA